MVFDPPIETPVFGNCEELDPIDERLERANCWAFEAVNLTREYVELVQIGGSANIQKAYQMQIPKNHEDPGVYETFEFYPSPPTIERLRECSREMGQGEFELTGINRGSNTADSELDELDKRNIRSGYGPNEYWHVVVDFLFRDWISLAPSRGGFEEYTAAITYSLYKGELKIMMTDVNNDEFCGGPPLGVWAGQPGYPLED